MAQVSVALGALDFGAHMPWLWSWWVLIAPGRTPCQKLGQPVPDSNLASELNSSLPQQTQR